MGDVEALDALGQVGQAEGVLQLFLNGFGVGFEHAKTLIVGLFGVGAGEIEESALVAALRDENMNAGGAGAFARDLLGEQIFESFAVLEIYGNVEIARDVGLADVELLEQERRRIRRG